MPQANIQESIERSLKTRSPVLHHINPDTSWLLQIPRRVDPADDTPNTRYWYNILIDPWLSGSQIDIASWFSQQWHIEPCSIASIAELEALAEEVERLSRKSEEKHDETERLRSWEDADSLIDAVAVLHEFTDHAHKATMLQLHPSVPVFATARAAAMIRSWDHFHTVEEIPIFPRKSNDWRDCSMPPLPSWLSIVHLVSVGEPLYFHSALMFVFNNDASGAPSERTPADAIVYTPHGLKASELSLVNDADPPIRALALLHGRHEVYLGKGPQLNLGANNGHEAQQILKARYWIGTHDEIKIGSGFIGWLLNFKKVEADSSVFKEIRNGQSIVLA